MDIISFLNKLKPINVACVGDIMLDEYFDVRVSRVSPEFPVQVMVSEEKASATRTLPGGAGNVVYQFKHFPVNPYLLGFIGKKFKYWAKGFQDHFYPSFDFTHCVELPYGRIPLKRRFYDGDFALPRWDIEMPYYGYGEEEIKEEREKLLSNFKQLISTTKMDVVILSDYNKGVFDQTLAQEIIKLCNNKDIPTIVDPKKHYSWYKFCTLFKPNLLESAALSGEENIADQCDFFRSRLDCNGVIITKGGEGVKGVNKLQSFEYLPSQRYQNVQSVIGAGDCFCAFLAIALGNKLSIEDAVELAFEAGATYVQTKHNKPISPFKLHQWLDPVDAKITDVGTIRQETRKKNVVFSNGCWDILHSQHIELLKFAKSKGDVLVVGINSDDSVKVLKGEKRPIKTLNERISIISALEFVDFVIPFNDETPLKLIEALRPNVLVKGSEYQIEDIVGNEIAEEVYLFPYKQGISSTDIINKMV